MISVCRFERHTSNFTSNSIMADDDTAKSHASIVPAASSPTTTMKQEKKPSTTSPSKETSKENQTRSHTDMALSVYCAMNGNGNDTEATSTSTDAPARYNYTGMYRLNIIYDEFTSLVPQQIPLQSFGGYIAFRPISATIDDEYNVAVALHSHSDKILTTQLYISRCMDHITGTTMDDEDNDETQPPYDDIIDIRNVQWTAMPSARTDGPENEESSVADVTDPPSSSSSDGMMDIVVDTDDDDIHRLENILVTILTKCDMIQFIGNDRLVLEGPKGAIECIMEPREKQELMHS